MKTFGYNLSLKVIKVFNAVLITLPFAIAWYLCYSSNILHPYYRKGNYIIVLLFLFIYYIYGRIYDAFLVSLLRISEMVYSQVLSALIADIILFIVIILLYHSIPSVLPMLLVLAAQIVLASLWSMLAHQWYFKTYGAQKTVIVYDQREGMHELIKEYGLKKKFDIVKIIHVKECMEDLHCLDGIETVFLCGIHSHDRNVILKYCIMTDITAYVFPRIGDVIMSGAKRMHLFHLLMLKVGRYSPSLEFLVVKRAFDILASLTTIILLSPVFIVTAIAIKSDGGPVLYKQTRLTKDGKEFKVWKFRSMRVDAEKDGIARLSSGENDDRITKVGHIIRKFRIDELPQMFNILQGSMSIVGPRPERPEIARQYEEILPEFSLRLQAKAGLTGLAQVYGKYNTTPYDKLQMDLFYIANASLLEDLRIIFATIKILFMPDSTQGIDEGQITAMESKEK